MQTSYEVEVYAGELVSKLIASFSAGLNLGFPLSTPAVCSKTKVHLSEEDLNYYVQLTELLHAFELLATHTFITAPEGRREEVFDTIKNLLNLPDGGIDPSEVSGRDLLTYLELSSTLRALEMVALYRFGALPHLRKRIAAELIATSKRFFQEQPGYCGTSHCQDTAGNCVQCPHPPG